MTSGNDESLLLWQTDTAATTTGAADVGGQRIVHVNDPARSGAESGAESGAGFARNNIRTTKYRWYSFIPRNLFEQFHRLAYVFSFIIAMLNLIPVLEVYGRAVSLAPVLAVFFITALKDGYEDWGRYKSDVAENNRQASVFQGDGYHPMKWKDIQVGDVVRVCANETIPCDMVLLGSSDPSGVAYVQTINLDGESNLKSMYAHQESASREPQLRPTEGVVQCELPHKDIYQFQGNLCVEGRQQLLPLGPKNIILRGCQLKNTEWVVGVVVYAGQETKVMLNSSGAPSKRSKLERKMDTETLWFLVYMLICCTVGAVGTLVWLKNHEDVLDRLPYYKRKSLDGSNYRYHGLLGEAAIAFLSIIISSQSLIPLGLYISLEFGRLGQSYLMEKDREMFHDESNTPFQCRALNINEDLGQIDYVFSDKTGTLTENRMLFHTASINGVKYPTREPEPKNEADKTRADAELVRVLESPRSSDERFAVINFFLVLAACNTVVPILTNKSEHSEAATVEYQGESPNKSEHSEAATVEYQGESPNKSEAAAVEYQGESPDEQALVLAAASYGFKLVERTASTVVIESKGSLERYKILGIHEFDSVRKRMSVVLECPDKTIRVLVKGADSHMLEIVNSGPGAESEVFQMTKTHLNDFSVDGLRTLVIATRELKQAEFEEWWKLYHEATSALADRSKKLDIAACSVERQLTLLGATGIEDKLQDGVPEAIASLREAGIKVWLLTGDKQETAISIGFSSALLTLDMQQLIINVHTKEDCAQVLATSKDTLVQDASQFDGPFALIIDGNSLVHALSSDLEQELFDVAVQCQAVLCCRLAPYQKAAIVTLMRKKDKATTLSIGDGANDVAMIQAADIGVGICGQEGRQAVMASDFAMAQFRFIKRLLFVHGHWNQQRLSYMILYVFYRTTLYVVMLYWYVFYSAFSPQPPMFEWNNILYYISIPVLVLVVTDQLVSADTLLKNPGLYGSGRRNEYYNKRRFWLTMLDTLWQSLVLFYVPIFTYGGSDIDIWSLGNFWSVAVVITVNLYLAMDTHYWTWILHLSLWASILVTFFCQLIFSSITSDSFTTQYGVIFRMIGTANYWLDMLLAVTVALLPRFLVKTLLHRCFPSDDRIAREAELLRRR